MGLSDEEQVIAVATATMVTCILLVVSAYRCMGHADRSKKDLMTVVDLSVNEPSPVRRENKTPSPTRNRPISFQESERLDTAASMHSENVNVVDAAEALNSAALCGRLDTNELNDITNALEFCGKTLGACDDENRSLPADNQPPVADVDTDADTSTKSKPASNESTSKPDNKELQRKAKAAVELERHNRLVDIQDNARALIDEETRQNMYAIFELKDEGADDGGYIETGPNVVDID